MTIAVLSCLKLSHNSTCFKHVLLSSACEDPGSANMLAARTQEAQEAEAEDGA